MMAPTRESDRARFHEKAAPDDKPDGCIVWTSSLTTGGYGSFWAMGRPWAAHRWSYREFVGPLDQHLVIDHVCRVRKCVNPAHLRQVTGRENTFADGSLAPARVNALKTHCIRGHEFTESNTYVFSDGGRRCRECALVRVAAWRKASSL